MAYDHNLHLTDSQFNASFRKATEKDFQLGMTYYKRTRFFERYIGSPVLLGKGLVEAAVSFMNDIQQGVAYIKKDAPPASAPVVTAEKIAAPAQEVKEPVPLKDQTKESEKAPEETTTKKKADKKA